MNRYLLAVASLFADTAIQAQTIPVSGGGMALAIAVANAPNGAVLVVSPGTYDPFDAAQRRLTLVAPQRATIQYSPASIGPTTLGVSGISAAQPFRMIGFDVVQGYSLTFPGYVWGVVHCSNAHFEDCMCQGIHATGGTLLVAGCTSTAVGGAALLADLGANVALIDSSFVGGYVYAPWGPAGAYPGIDLRASNLRAERIDVRAVSAGGQCGAALSIYGSCTVTIADSVLIPGPPYPSSTGASIACAPTTTLTVSGSQTPGGITCAHTTTPLATLRWLTRQWTPGGTSTLRSQHLSSTLAIAVISTSAVPFASPLLAEQSFVGASADWFVHTFGVSNAVGEFDWNLALPPSPSLLYAEAWLHGVSMPGLPLHASTPLGGLIR